MYQASAEPGLLSVLTPVWDGSPARHLRTLAESLVVQNAEGTCEWVILDNGSSKEELRTFLRELGRYPWVNVHRIPKNVGITAGLRVCLEQAKGRYVLPIDGDDCLYQDAFRVITRSIRDAGYPALLYTDEDKIYETRPCQPYMKPDWDPVLFLNSAYTAHLGILERRKALELGVYSDVSAEGSPDWDAFVRFTIAGYTPVHIPEVLYSWRIHARSTADQGASKPYVHTSQRAVLEKFLKSRSNPGQFGIRQSPLFGRDSHWHFVLERRDPKPVVSLVLGRNGRGGNTGQDHPKIRQIHVDLGSGFERLLPFVNEMAQQDGLVHFVGEDVRIEGDDWLWEALGLFELHEDAAMVGGRIRNAQGLITGAGLHFGFGGVCGCPDRHRSFRDAGYFAQTWKQRSVSAVSTQFAVVKATFLAELLRRVPRCASLTFLGGWAGAHAFRTQRRIVYSPFLSGISDLDWETLFDVQEQTLFAEMNRDLIPDSRFYSRHFSLEKPFALRESATMAANA